MKTLSFLILFGGTALAQTSERVSAPADASHVTDVKTLAEPAVPAFPSQRARFPASFSITPGDPTGVPIDSVNRDPIGWMPNPPDRFAPKPANAALDPRVPKQALRRIDHSRMYYSTSDGTLWARGEHYKASFDESGVTYYPIFGKRQPHHAPHVLSPDRVTVGGETLAFESSVHADRAGDRVEIDRGAFTEAYELTPQAVEQTFVFSSLPRSGDLVVHIPVASELGTSASDDGLEFRGDLGRVTFGRATAIDARGERSSASTMLVDGSIEIRVDASFLASAALPLVIDPLVSTFAIDDTFFDAYWADAAYAAAAHKWLVVYEDWVTSTDRDCWSALLFEDGSGLSWDAFDVSTDSWDSVHVATVNIAGNWPSYLVASSVTHGSQVSVKVVGGSILGGTSGMTMGSAQTITGTESGTVRNCVVGGDTGGTMFCVAYERQYSATDWDILVRDVDIYGNRYPFSGPLYLSNSGGTVDVAPAISKSAGGHDWMIVWQRNNGTNNQSDIYGAIVGRPVSSDIVPITAYPYAISAWPQPSSQAAVSSPLGSSLRYLVTWTDTYPGDHDVILALVDGSTILDLQDLSVMEQYDYLLDQIEPTVDSDGGHFLVAYSELYSWPDYDTYASEVYVDAGNTIALAQVHVNMDYATTKDHSPRVVSCKMSGATDAALEHRYLAAWNSSPNPNGPADVLGALFDGTPANPTISFCYGNGSSGPCPCMNPGAAGHGCENSSFTGGALLTTSGIALLSHDTLRFTAQGEKPNALSTLIQGLVQTLPVAFGQGSRCVAVGLKRLYTQTASNGVVTVPSVADPSVHVRSEAQGDTISAGATRYYYMYYRDQVVLGGCSPSATFNATQGVGVTWAQ
jgi:hypothetical protein